MTVQDDIERLLHEGDRLLYAALVQRNPVALDRLHSITHELTNDYSYNGSELGRRWHRKRTTISVWKKKGADVRRRNSKLP